MKSMTGFGRASACVGDIKFTIEISSVNKRSLEIVVNTPKEFYFFEILASAIIKKQISRGRVRVGLNVDYGKCTDTLTRVLEEKETEVFLDRLQNFIEKRNGNFVLTPEVLIQAVQLNQRDGGPENTHQFSNSLTTCLEEAMTHMIEMRALEGSQLKQDFLNRLKILEKMISEMDANSQNLSDNLRDKLIERLENANLNIDPSDERVMKEVIMYAEKSDVSEEITRLKSHISQFFNTCKLTVPVGRKLEFIIQEMGRELNTFSSKTARNMSSSIALEARVEVEKLREQVLNIE